MAKYKNISSDCELQPLPPPYQMIVQACRHDTCKVQVKYTVTILATVTYYLYNCYIWASCATLKI